MKINSKYTFSREDIEHMLRIYIDEHFDSNAGNLKFNWMEHSGEVEISFDIDNEPID